MNERSLHPPGDAPNPRESNCRALVPAQGPVTLDTFGGCVHVEVGPLGGGHAARSGGAVRAASSCCAGGWPKTWPSRTAGRPASWA
jgi:hypothetical protein